MDKWMNEWYHFSHHCRLFLFNIHQTRAMSVHRLIPNWMQLVDFPLSRICLACLVLSSWYWRRAVHCPKNVFRDCLAVISWPVCFKDSCWLSLPVLPVARDSLRTFGKPLSLILWTIRWNRSIVRWRVVVTWLLQRPSCILWVWYWHPLRRLLRQSLAVVTFNVVVVVDKNGPDRMYRLSKNYIDNEKHRQIPECKHKCKQKTNKQMNEWISYTNKKQLERKVESLTCCSNYGIVSLAFE